MLQEIILTLALQLIAGPTYGEYDHLESVSQYYDRLDTIAEAIVIETSPENRHHLWGWDQESLAFAVLSTWYYESRFDLRVHEGSKHPRYSQDNGFAKCMGQIHIGIVSKSEWYQLPGTDLESTRKCAKATIKVLSRWFYRCGYKNKKPNRGRMMSMFGGYKTGRGCWSDKNSSKRATLWSDLYRRKKKLTIVD